MCLNKWEPCQKTGEQMSHKILLEGERVRVREIVGESKIAGTMATT